MHTNTIIHTYIHVPSRALHGPRVLCSQPGGLYIILSVITYAYKHNHTHIINTYRPVNSYSNQRDHSRDQRDQKEYRQEEARAPVGENYNPNNREYNSNQRRRDRSPSPRQRRRDPSPRYDQERRNNRNQSPDYRSDRSDREGRNGRRFHGYGYEK